MLCLGLNMPFCFFSPRSCVLFGRRWFAHRARLPQYIQMDSSFERKKAVSRTGLDLNNNCSCQECDRLLFNCSVRGCRENTMRKTTCLVCDATLPATGMDKTDNLPIGITETLHIGLPRFIMVFTSFDAFILPLGKT